MDTPCDPFRILVLPGVAQNAATFAGKLAPLVRSLEGIAELVFIDPTHELVVPTFHAPFSLTLVQDQQASDQYAPRAWWNGDPDGLSICRGLDESLVYLRHVLEQQGPFDGVMGFSQGAATAALLVGLLEHPDRDPIFAAPCKDASISWPPPPPRFCIFAGGFFPRDPRVRAVSGIDTPSLHILGRGDAVVADHESDTLIAACHSPRVEYHDGGHHIPTKPSWALFLAEWISSFRPGGAEGGLAVQLSPKVTPKDWGTRMRSPSVFSLEQWQRRRSESMSSGEVTNDGVTA